MTILFLALWLQMSAPQLGAPPFTSEPSVISSADGTIQIGGWPLDDLVLSEIPDESAWGNQANGSCNMGKPVLAADETDGKSLLTAAEPIRYCLENEFINIEGKELATCDKGQWVISDWMKRAAEPVDVPAVQVGEQLSYDCGQGIACIDHYVPIYSCKDKSRILEHDENSPPKYWCRKVEF